MKIEVVEDRRNTLLNRREIRFQAESDITPARTVLKSELVKSLKAKEELLVVDKLRQISGGRVSEGYTKIYDDPESLKRIELAHKLTRGTKKKGKPEEASGEAKAASDTGKTPDKPAKQETKVEETPVGGEKEKEGAEGRSKEPEQPTEEKQPGLGEEKRDG
jgi:ribosomal protein S24E